MTLRYLTNVEENRNVKLRKHEPITSNGSEYRNIRFIFVRFNSFVSSKSCFFFRIKFVLKSYNCFFFRINVLKSYCCDN